MKKKITLSLPLIFLTFLTYSQSNTILPKIVPPSPNAAALAQYADIPVSNYTGVPNISIPLFDIKSGKIELPVTLSYHASGIKVAQEASSVGLGWALNAGGVITRQVRGFDDFKQGGYLSTIVPPSTSDNLQYVPGGNALQYWNNYYMYLNSPDPIMRIDGEPDIFYFNFMGFSGQFFFQQQNYVNGTLTAVCVDQNNLKISFNGLEWIITDGNGWKYYFGKSSLYAVENTTDYDYNIDGHFSTNPYIFNSRNIMPYDSATETTDTAWYLTKVIIPEGDEIDFQYFDNFPYKTLSNLSYSERLVKLVNLTNLTRPIVWANRFFSSFGQQVVQDVYLKKIIFKNGYIDFKTEDRDDLRKYANSSYIVKPQRIKSAELFDLANTSIKKIDFNYSYFNDNMTELNPTHKEDFLRLRLDSVLESFKDRNSGIYSSYPPYIFKYNSNALPDKVSFSVDHWGYFNNKNNDNIDISGNNSGITIGMLTPSYTNLNAVDVKYLPGANRDVNPDVAQAAILKEIKYPLGGSMKLNYESNTYSYDDKSAVVEKETVNFFGGHYHDRPTDPAEKEETITVIEPLLLTLNFYVYKNDYNYSDHPTPFVGVAFLKNINNGSVITSLNSEIPLDEWGNYVINKTIFLQPGTYQIYVDKGNDTMSDVIFDGQYEKSIDVYQYKKNGPGIRISSIESIDKENVIKRKKYSYDESGGFSSGRLLSPVNYWYNESLTVNTNNSIDSDQGSYDGLTNFIVRMSNSVVPFGYSAQGKVLGYNEVSVSDLDANNISLGDTQFFYKNVADIPANYFLPGTGNRINLNNGELTKEIQRNKDGKTVKQKDYFYENNLASRIIIKGVKRYDIGFPYEKNHLPDDVGMDLTEDPIPQIRFLDIESEWRFLKTTTETLYDLNGLNPITNTTNYKYDNPLHKNLTETQTINSKGQQIITTNQYPSDQPEGNDMTTSDYNLMVSKNILNPIIKQQTKLDTNLLSTQVTTYKKWNLDVNQDNIPDDIFLPKYVKTAKGTNSLENRIQYHSYYPDGNIQELSKTDGTHIVYIWGYNNQYPIAMIENAVYNEVSSYVTDLQNKSNLDTDHCLDTQACKEKELRDALNNMRNDATYKTKWQVTTYTYNPLIGMTSSTDPKGYTLYYTYDAAGRLQFVKDKNDNILSENQYNYKQ